MIRIINYQKLSIFIDWVALMNNLKVAALFTHVEIFKKTLETQNFGLYDVEWIEKKFPKFLGLQLYYYSKYPI